MKAAVLEELQKITFMDVDTPEIDVDEVLVKVHACAVCGSDLRIYRSGNDRVKPPQILGHEISGEVVAVGDRVTKVKVGDKVAIGADVPCGECYFCEAGIGNNCMDNHAMGYQFPGGFAQYVKLNRMTMLYGPVHVIPDDADYSEYALAEPLGCVLNALERTPIEMGETVVVIGCGPIGCMMIPVIRLMGAAKVICVERAPSRQKVALESGADVVLDWSQVDIVEEVKKLTGGLGADVVITATPVGAMHAKALQMAKKRGKINLFGGLPADNSIVEMDNNLIHYKELLVSGAHGSLPRHHGKAVQLIADGVIDVKPYITHKMPLSKIQEAFDTASARECMRVVVRPWED